MGKMLASQMRLDGALACPGLTSKASIESLVERQLLRSPFYGTEEQLKCTVNKRTEEVSDFLDMLRSASRNNKDSSSGSSQSDWKVKQESDQLRVMYREGPPGTPFHTLLCEGYVDGPIDSCLCVSWESTLYKKWWPQYNIPTFKIIYASTLRKIRIGEEEFIVRVKVPWPMSDREALLHCFELECFEEDLVIVLMNSVHETKGIDTNANGFLMDGIPEAENIVRIDVVGGFALQKVSSGRSYFRGIANMDIKFDFVPPSLINFLSRQLIGNGHKLYSKAVAAVTAGDAAYRQALNGDMYSRIRESLYGWKRDNAVGKDGGVENALENKGVETVSGTNISSEIIEEHAEENIEFTGRKHIFVSSTEASVSSVIPEQSNVSDQRISISLEVKQALSILDKAIAVYHDLRSSDSKSCPCGASKNLETKDGMKDVSKRENCNAEIAGTDTSFVQSNLVDRNTRKEHTLDSFYMASTDEQGIALQQSRLVLSVDDTTLKSSALNDTNEAHKITQTSVLERMSKVFDEVSVRTNGTYHSSCGNDEPKMKPEKRTTKSRCCWSFL